LILKVENLHKYYGYGRKNVIKAVNGVSFEVQEGDIFALLGLNGAGKTTTIRCILGLCKKDSGNITYNGKYKIAYVPEGKDLYGSYKVKKMIEITKSITQEFDENKCLKYINEFKIPQNERVLSLSNGQKTQLYLSLVLSQKADLYIFDEPTWGLDPVVRNRILDMIKAIPLEGGTVFYTSHILSEVERVADKVAIMHQGRILEIGYLDDIKESFCAVTIERSASKSSTVPEIDGYLYKSTEGEDIYIVKKAYAEERHLDFQPVPFEVLFEALVLGQKSQEQDKTV